VAQPSPFIFLSHSGADTQAARELKRRLENAPEAKAAGLKVWFDKDHLRPGTPWSDQIAEAIQSEATAFVVFVGSGGVMNWVDTEVDLALSRATTDKQNPLLFIPALAAETNSKACSLPQASSRGTLDKIVIVCSHRAGSGARRDLHY
jgi:TIR domain